MDNPFALAIGHASSRLQDDPHRRLLRELTVPHTHVPHGDLAGRYRDAPNLVWSMTPKAPQEFVPILRELAAGLREGDGGRHLVTFKPDPAPYSSSFVHAEEWLDFDSMQTWNRVNLIDPFVIKDYNLKPVKPVLLAEGASEAGSEYGFSVTPLWVRRQAYDSYLAGAHHTYGDNDSKLEKLSTAGVNACWIDPPTGDATPIGAFDTTLVSLQATGTRSRFVDNLYAPLRLLGGVTDTTDIAQP